ncbi:MAG: ShET2/EspL2 family type III secretion system effector toxin [Burkholderiales bacterium]|jgi:ankyrin repeat protein|nr:ShET2/EspL2 family type III secretion system effector toxin [Burkholderiales bacterium]
MAPRSGSPARAPSRSDAADRAGAVTDLKRVPYYSSKPGRDPEVKLNQLAYFPGHEGNDAELIECRHLAVAWLRQHEVNPCKPDYRAFESKKAIARNVPRSEQVAYDTLVAAQTDLHIVKPGDWGRFAGERFREMERNGADVMRMLVESTMHTMAAEFKIKRKPGQPPQYVQKVYDPNSTLTHKRASTHDLGNVQERKIKDFLKHEDLSLVYFGSKALLVRAIPEGGLTNLPDVPPGGPVGRRTANGLPPLDETVMYFLLADGFGGSLRDLKPSILQLARVSEEGATELLAAYNIDEDTGLYAAVTKGMADATSAFCDIVRDCTLSDELKVELLAGQAGDGVPALHTGMQEGHAEAVRALIGGIIDSGLDVVRRAKLLIATDLTGEPALSVAMRMGQHQSVSALVDGLERSDFPSPVVAALLQGPRPDRTLAPALALGMREGREDAVRMLMEGIANSTKLNVVHKHHLLSARNQLGLPALSVAVLSGLPRSIAVFVDVVAGSDLPHEAKRDLLLALDANRVPALAAAVHHDRGESVQAYAEAVLSSVLPASSKVELLQAEHQGWTAYRVALARGSDSVAAALREAVSQSSLSPEDRVRVLDDAPRRRRVG